MVVANPPQLWESKLLFHPPQISARSLCWWCQSRSQKHKLSANPTSPNTHTLYTSLESTNVNWYIHTYDAWEHKQFWIFPQSMTMWQSRFVFVHVMTLVFLPMSAGKFCLHQHCVHLCVSMCLWVLIKLQSTWVNRSMGEATKGLLWATSLHS